MDVRALSRSLWAWFALALTVQLTTFTISSATGTPGDGNDTGVAEVANTIGFVAMMLVLPLLVAAIVQTVRRRRRALT